MRSIYVVLWFRTHSNKLESQKEHIIHCGELHRSCIECPGPCNSLSGEVLRRASTWAMAHVTFCKLFLKAFLRAPEDYHPAPYSEAHAV